MRERFLPENIILLFRLMLAQSVTGFFLILSLMSFSLPYASSVRPEFFMMLVYYWAVYRPTLISPLFVFILGLIIDIVSGLPIGLNAAALLLLQWLVQRQRLFLVGQSFIGLWIGFMVAVFGVIIFKWSIVSLLTLSVLPFSSALLSALTSIFVFPLVTFLLLGVHKILPVHA